MRALIIGATGFIGSYLHGTFKKKYEVTGTSTYDGNFRNLDMSKFDKTCKILKEINPDVICLPAGMTNLDYVEKHPAESRKVNVLGTKNIADYCKSRNCRLIFFSSDAVFNGKKGPYSENEKPNPVSVYGRQKLEAEDIVKKLDDFVIIRTSSVYGWDKKRLNFVSRLIESLKSNKEFKAPIDQYYTPTYVLDLANAALRLAGKEFNGVYNITGPDFMNRYEIALNVCKIFKLKKELVIPVKSPQLGQAAKRPKYGGLVNKKAVKELGIKLRSLKEGLNAMLENAKN